MEFNRIKLDNADYPLRIPTYENSEQATHPDIIEFLNPLFNNYRYMLAFTPYSYSNDKYENPSIVFSNNGIKWYEDYIKNPIVDNQYPDKYWFCDPDLVYANNKFYLYFLTGERGGKLFRKTRALYKQYSKTYSMKLCLVISKDGVK